MLLFVLTRSLLCFRLPANFWCPTKLQMPDGEVKEYPLPSVPYPNFFVNSEGLVYEAQHVRECLQQGKVVGIGKYEINL